MVQGAIYSHLMYCSSVWYHRMTVKSYRHAVQMVQRRCDIMCSRLYSTTSAAAAAIINNMAPLDLKIIGRSIQWLVKRERGVPLWEPFARITEYPPPPKWLVPVRSTWQQRWHSSGTGMWMRELLPSVEARQQAPVPNITFWLGQALSGDGVFAAYLHKFKRRDSPLCPCGSGEEESAKHVFRYCVLRAANRPIDWSRPTEKHFEYMTEVVRNLWVTENPGQQLDQMDQHAVPQDPP